MTSVETQPKTSSTSEWTTYEFPLNERIRTLLRLEGLFKKFQFFFAQDHQLDHHAALLTLFEIIEVGSRADLKSDLIQELDRQKQTLSQYQDHPGVDPNVLGETLAEIDRVSSSLTVYTGRLGHHLRDNEFLMVIRSRCSIPGGVSEFDLPSYHRWQSKPAPARRANIEEWFEPMRALAQGISLVLSILRDGGEPIQATALNGNFTQQLSGKSFHLLRVKLPPDLDIVPEFSANKYMLWIRFNKPDKNGVCKNNPYDGEIKFQLKLCHL